MTAELPRLPEPWQGYLEHISTAADRFWSQHRLNAYGRVQSPRIWKELRHRLNQLARLSNADPLTAFETFLVHAAAYLYEAGWQTPGAPQLAPADRYARSGAIIRASVARSNVEMDLGLAGLDPLTVETLAALCESVGRNDLSKIELGPTAAGYLLETRPRYMAAQLQLADMLLIHRANDAFLRALSALPPDDLMTVRIAASPYVALIRVHDNVIVAQGRLHPEDADLVDHLVDVFEYPLRNFLAEHGSWLAKYDFRLRLAETNFDIAHDGLLPSPIAATYKALRPFLESFQPARPPEDEVEESRQVERILADQYEILEVLEPTNHSQVFRARDTRLQRDVAIKLVAVDLPANKSIKQRLQDNLIREARILADLDHPNIGRVYTTIAQPLAVVMQWIEGTSLEQLLAGTGPLPPAQAAAIGAAVAAALDYAHAKGVVHRDIKPGNIIVNEAGVPILIDFDISRSRWIDTISMRDDGSHMYLGSPDYSAPEQFLIPETVGPQADVFALGVVLYQLLTHQLPFRQGNLPGNYKPPLLPTPQPYDIPDDLYQIICASLRTASDERPTARVLAQQLRVWLQKQSASGSADRLNSGSAGLASQMELGDAQAKDHRTTQPAAHPLEAASRFQPSQPGHEPLQVMIRFKPIQPGMAAVTWEGDAIDHTESTLHLPYTPEILPLVIKALDAIQHPGHPDTGPRFSLEEQQILASHDMWVQGRVAADLHKIIGQRLYASLTADRNAAEALKTIRESARIQRRAISYTYRFPDTAVELAALPWELLWDRRQAILLSRGAREIDWCQRFIDVGEAFTPPTHSGKRPHVLALSPRAGIPETVRHEERSTREKIWEDLKEQGLLDWDELSPVSIAHLYQRMRQRPIPDVIHYYGHGVYAHGKGYLLLDHTDGFEMVDVERLAALLGGIRLIVLHACQSATVRDLEHQTGILTGIGPALSLISEAVVAMQLTVRITAATRFLEIFYDEIGRGAPVQAAVAEARRALYVIEGADVGWYVPTLYLRSREQKPFYIMPM